MNINLIISKLKKLRIETNFKEMHGFIGFKAIPMIIMYPYNEDDIINIIEIASESHAPINPWDTGTSLIEHCGL